MGGSSKRYRGKRRSAARHPKDSSRNPSKKVSSRENSAGKNVRSKSYVNDDDVDSSQSYESLSESSVIQMAETNDSDSETSQRGNSSPSFGDRNSSDDDVIEEKKTKYASPFTRSKEKTHQSAGSSMLKRKLKSSSPYFENNSQKLSKLAPRKKLKTDNESITSLYRTDYDSDQISDWFRRLPQSCTVVKSPNYTQSPGRKRKFRRSLNNTENYVAGSNPPQKYISRSQRKAKEQGELSVFKNVRQSSRGVESGTRTSKRSSLRKGKMPEWNVPLTVWPESDCEGSDEFSFSRAFDAEASDDDSDVELDNLSFYPNYNQMESEEDEVAEVSSIDLEPLTIEEMEDCKERNDYEDDEEGATAYIPNDEKEYEEKFDIPSNVLTFSSAKTGVVILIAPHPTSFTFHGKAAIRVISGTVDVFGYDLCSRTEEFLPLYSTRKLCSVPITTKAVDWKNASHWANVKKNLSEFVNKEVVRSVLDSCKDLSVIIILKKHDYAVAADFVCQYIPQALALTSPEDKSTKLMEKKGFNVSGNDDYTIAFTKGHQDVADSIQAAVRVSSADGRPPPRIVFYGKRGLGKSTLLRYAINKVLSIHERVCYMECDPGQTEFTSPGCLSLVEVRKPLLGPPFTHQKIPEKAIFYGSINISNADYYNFCIEELMGYYNENFPDVPLFVNTFGWLKGIGRQCLNYILKVVSPTLEVELLPPPVSSENGDNIVESRVSPHFYDSGRIDIKLQSCRPARRLDFLNAPTRRSLAVLAYFSRCQPYYEACRLLNDFQPYSVVSNTVAIHVVGFNILPDSLLRAVNASIVALCEVDPSQMLLCTDGSLPGQLIPDSGYGTCHGFGFVRAIDQEKGLLFVITPLPFPVLRTRVNAIVKGNIEMPNEVYFKQALHGESLPYVMQMLTKKSAASRKIKRL